MTSQASDPPSTPGAGGSAGGVLVVLQQMQHQMGELNQSLWAARGRTELMDTVAALEALKSTTDAVELAVVRELDATGAVKPGGWASTQDFVTSIAGGHKVTGPAVVRLAKAVNEPVLAPVGVAMGDGWLSTVKAHAIERAVGELPGDPDLRARAVQVLLDEAKRLDATELRKVTRRLLSIVDPDGDERRVVPSSRDGARSRTRRCSRRP